MCYDPICKQPSPHRIQGLRACTPHYIEALEHGADFLMPQSDQKLAQLIAQEKKSSERVLGNDSVLVSMPVPNKTVEKPPVL